MPLDLCLQQFETTSTTVGRKRHESAYLTQVCSSLQSINWESMVNYVDYSPKTSFTRLSIDLAYKEAIETKKPISTMIDNQFAVLQLAKEMFKSAKPLEGRALNTLNKTYSRLFSKYPTRL